MSVLQVKTSAELTALEGTATAGDTYFNSDTKNIRVWDGTNWRGYVNDGRAFTSNTHSAFFDGVNDYIDTNTKFDFMQQTCNFSMTFWLKFTDYTTVANQFLLANSFVRIWYDNRGGNTFSQNGLRIIVSPTVAFDAPNALTDDEWHHIAATCSASGSIKLYVDGSEILTATAPPTNSDSSTETFKIGAASNTTLPFGGYLDEVAIFNRELTSTEISNIINYKAYSNFSAMYRLENNADDEAGFNDGTNNGATFKAKADGTTNTPY